MMRSPLKRWNETLGLGAFPSTGTAQSLQWLMFARLFLLYFVLGVIVLQQVFRREAFSEFQICLGYSLLAISFAFTLFNALVLDRFVIHWSIVALHIVFDAAVTSLWLILGDNKGSLFALFYLLQILFVSLTFFQKGALFASLLSSFCFALVMLLNPTPLANPWLNWGTFSGIFLTLGLVGGYLSEELSRTNVSLREKQLKIEKLTALHESIISNMPTGLLTVDGEMRVNFINPAAEHILGQSSERVVGRFLHEVEPDLVPFFSQIETEDVNDEMEENADPDLKLEATLAPSGADHLRTFFVETKSEKRHARLQQRVEVGQGLTRRILRGDVADLDPGPGIGKLLGHGALSGRVLLFQEVTKLVQLEERLKQNEKLAAVGQLAAGIAHEIRNPLASMSASIEMLKATLPPTDESKENQKLMDIAIREIDRLNRLISEFLDFVKPDRFKVSQVVLSSLLEELNVTIRRSKEFKGLIHFVERLEGDAVALANAEKLKQVIWNLLVNAIQAMTKGGTVEVGCATVSKTKVKFWVRDEGEGMSDEVMVHLYEPFFTTKEKGTGLGLATAYKIIEAHHGEIRVSSQVGVGTNFEVFLPRA